MGHKRLLVVFLTLLKMYMLARQPLFQILLTSRIPMDISSQHTRRFNVVDKIDRNAHSREGRLPADASGCCLATTIIHTMFYLYVLSYTGVKLPCRRVTNRSQRIAGLLARHTSPSRGSATIEYPAIRYPSQY